LPNKLPETCFSKWKPKDESAMRMKCGCGVAGVGVLLAALPVLQCQTASHRAPHEATLQQLYEAAQNFQSHGDLTQAEVQYKLFLADALHRIANGRAQTSQYAQAVPLFDEALKLAPNHSDSRLDYAEAALNARYLQEAAQLAHSALDSSPADSKSSQRANVHRVLGRALMGMKKNKEAKQQFEDAVALNPSFENYYGLAQVDLAMSDTKGAARVFAEMQSGFGDTAAIHMSFGRAFAEADFPEQAILEYRKVIAKDDKYPDAHYSLGASYLLRSGDTAFPQAEAEFRRELSIHPNDYFSYSQLGFIAMNLRKLPEAINDLTRAAVLNPENPDNFLLLGGIYNDLDKTEEAKDALRKAIAATTDVSYNHYQIRGAHYQLGLLLIQSGNSAEGKKEMKIAEDLLLQNRLLDQANLTGKPLTTPSFPKASADARAKGYTQAEREFEKQLGPAIADSFNNLGVISGKNQEYEAASSYFEQAAAWNPAMEGLDYNWGRAAYAAKQYHQAVLCLDRYLVAHPENVNARFPLGMSEFMLGDFKATISALSPVAAQLDDVPLLGYAYAVSLVKTGYFNRGVTRLRAIEQAHPDLAVIHRAVGEALSDQKNLSEAQDELRTAISLNPADANAKYDLSLALLAIGKTDDAHALLTALATESVKIPDVYYQLGRLELAHGDVKAAIANLEAATRMSPANDAAHRDLAEAYRLDSRPEDAAREMKQYQASQREHAANGIAPVANQAP
jgi:tetratricopeptide (TPR) repeat protein